VRRADDAAGLARAFDLPTAPVEAELAALGPGRAAGPDRFGRSFAHRPPFAPPYFGMQMTGVLAHTQGGLRIDDAARVLRADGRPVPGLYAAGASAAGISGISAAGYVPGNGLCHALTTGFIAGETVAEPIERSRHPASLCSNRDSSSAA
jgi:fumarate reductase flavoprotein subunit